MSDCKVAYIGLFLTGLALIISVSFNILLYSMRRRDQKVRDAEEYLYNYSERSEERFEEEVQQQDNPIYGNICTNGGEPEAENDVCYEQMAGPKRKQKQADVSYASLDLSIAKKHKKKRKFQTNQNQAHQNQTHQAHMTPQGSLEVADPEEEATLPSRSSSLMVSRHSIYLNSQQIAQEAQELEREKQQELGNAEGKTEDW
ncbi:T-cell receptor-associated transmembrane adapter 1 [Clupea harengus]|uniref:T-cell receptor-associated transmembrane adapter 1 n=1 Tax=Clupea harengus TaxID=7950 RepID=UPI001C58D869|nr:T-cell receptor-associated transmembrane adapter 1 [Clupea harengus]